MRFVHWLVHEVKGILVATLLFGACFSLVALLKSLMLEHYDIKATDYASVALLALVTAKVVVIFDKVSFGRHIGLVEVALRTTAYSLATFILLVIEHGLSGRGEAGGFVAAISGSFRRAEMSHVWVTLICVSLAFAAHAAFAILRREFGAERLRAAFLKQQAEPQQI